MEEQLITEEFVVEKIIAFMQDESNGNWHKEKNEVSKKHDHGVDIKLVGGKRNSERFFIECKGKSYSRSAKSINKEGWLNALGQIVTRMNVNRLSRSKKDGHAYTINTAYKYGLGLYWEGAQVALSRIPRAVAKILNLHIFAVNDNGEVRHFTPKEFQEKKYSDEVFLNFQKK